MRFIYTRWFLILSGILVVILIGLVMQIKGWLNPIEYVLLQAPRPVIAAVNWVTRPIATTINTLSSLPSLVNENNQLAQEVTDLRQQLVDYNQVKSENSILKDELQFVAKAPYNLQPCTILSADNQTSSDVINLNCGEVTGIRTGQAVIAKGYIIAKVVHVGKFTSAAVLITNAQQTVDARLSKNETEGIVKGSFGSGLVFDLVSQSAEVTQGDLIVTAGINPEIPRNILIGEVGQELSGPNDLFKQLTVTSPVKVHTIDHVFVVKP